MTLKYESELLFGLMKRDGDDAPSDVLPYESELKEKYLEQVEGAYPKLQDYQAEWLNYNLYYHLPSYFPVESVTNVTSASFVNVVPYAYKRAILKGNTLVNSWKKHNTYLPHNFTFHDDGFMELKKPVPYFDHIQTDISLLKPNTKYLLIIEAKNNTLPVETSFHQDVRSVFSNNGGQVLFNPKENGVRKVILTSNSDFSTTTNDLRWGVYISFAQEDMPENERGTISVRQMLIEYQEGMENWDIPYFEGMQSVKMPVLTTSNEDGTKTNILTANEEVELRGIGDVKDTLDCLTGEATQYFDEVILDGSDDEKFVYIPGYSNNDVALFEWENYFDYNIDALKRQGNMISDKFSVNPQYLNPTKEGIYCQYRHLNIMIEKSKLIELTTTGIRAYLKQNPFKMILPKQTKQNTVKTVDLTCINEQGESEALRPLEGTMHVSTSSQTLPPLLDMAVPVEATTQNLMSFVNIVEEE